MTNYSFSDIEQNNVTRSTLVNGLLHNEMDVHFLFMIIQVLIVEEQYPFLEMNCFDESYSSLTNDSQTILEIILVLLFQLIILFFHSSSYSDRELRLKLR